jgi:hypothetical protein
MKAYQIVQFCCILVEANAWGMFSLPTANRQFTSLNNCKCHKIQSISTKGRQLTTLNQHDSSRESTIAPVDSFPVTQHQSRRQMISKFSSLLLSVCILEHQPQPAMSLPEQKSYSSNARNMDRLSAGDRSGGSTYDNNPSAPAASRRRAMVGCKIEAAREKASSMSSDESVLAEKDCNIRVMNGDSEFMLEALRKLDCPTCPYGIDGA